MSDPTIFEKERRRLEGLAYRILGTWADAEDVVQDCGVKWLDTAPGEVRNPAAWLTTLVTRRALDVLRSARRTRVDYVGQWLPEPVLTDTGTSPEEQLELASSLSTAFLHLLETLGPKERAAFLLHEVFSIPHAAVAETLEVSEAASRQLVSRARRGISKRDVRHRPPLEEQRGMLSAFEVAIRTGDAAGLAGLLARDVRLRADGGGKAAAIRETIEGRAVPAFVADRLNAWWADFDWQVEELNGLLGVVLSQYGSTVAVATFSYDTAGRVTEIQIMRNPDKLRGV